MCVHIFTVLPGQNARWREYSNNAQKKVIILLHQLTGLQKLTMPPKVFKVVQKSSLVTETKTLSGHKCVMCELLLPTKPELQAHFRLHANGTIDMKGKMAIAPLLFCVQRKEWFFLMVYFRMKIRILVTFSFLLNCL